jgi:formate hydrogenlyase transcriptional activator
MTGRDDESERVYQALLGLVSDIAGYRSLQDLLRSLSTHLHELAPFDQLAVVLHDPGTNRMRFVMQEPPAQLDFSPPGIDLSSIPIDFGPSGWVWSSQRPLAYSLTGDQTHPTLDYLRRQGYRAVCFVPLTTRRARLGTLGFGSRIVERYAEDSIALMERIASLLALAIEHTAQIEHLATIGDTVASERDRARLLLDVTNAVASELDLAELLEAISKLLRETIPHHYASVTLWDEDARELRRHALVFGDSRGIIQNGALVGSATSPPRMAFDRGETVVLRWDDIARLDEHSHRVMLAEGLRSVCCVPLQTARCRHGTLNVAKPDGSGFAEEEVRLLEQIAQQLAVAIENAMHFQQAERYRREATKQRDRLQLLLDVNNALVAQLDSHSFQLSVLAPVRRAVPHDYASLTLYDAESRAMCLEAVTCYDERGETGPGTMLPLGRSPSGIAFTERKALVFDQLDQFQPDGVSALRQAGIRSICCVPLTTRRGVIGTLNVGWRSGGVCPPEQVDLLADVAGQVAIAVENTLAFRQISDLKDRLSEENRYLEAEITSRHDFREIIGNSRALTSVLDQIRTVAPTDATVLLLGETGTGKELLARAIHESSRRRERTFVRINGAALPAGLIESELFGYEKGAFTGAVATKVGRLELAHRGTLFLDEVGDIPIDVQPKLLRALQEREFERVGSTRTQQVDVRLIAATNRNLEEMAAAGSFRSDLYYRLSVFPIQVPPLRDRPEDIPPLVAHFVRRFAREMGRSIPAVPAAVMDALAGWRWPGNIRELQNVIERAVILSRGTTPLQVPAEAFQRPAPSLAAPVPGPARLDYASGERDLILGALRASRGVIAGPEGAAARLGLKRTTLHSKMRKLGIERPSF